MTLPPIQSGQTITLPPGTYGKLSLTGKSGVTIQSQDPLNPAVFTSGALTGCSNIKLEGVEFRQVCSSATADYTATLKFDRCDMIAFTGSVIGGLMPSGPRKGFAEGRGIWATQTTGLSFTDSDFTGHKHSIYLTDCAGVTVKASRGSGYRCAFVVGGNNSMVDVSGNSFGDARPWQFGNDAVGGDHGDHVHFFTKNGLTCDHISIIGNTVLQGGGSPIMGFSLQITGGGGFSNVAIEDNVLSVGNGQGMRLENLDGFTIKHNAIVTCAGYERVTPKVQMLAGCSQGVIDGNIWAGAAGAQAGLATGKNLIVQMAQPAASTYAGRALVNPLGTTRADFVALASGPGAGLGIH